MNENRDTALGLLRKATDDLHAAMRLAQPPAASQAIIGFHAQQTVEKAIKAVLANSGIHYPFTHDIAALTALTRKSGVPLPPESEDLCNLTPLATLFRYEDEELDLPTSMGPDRMLLWAESTLAWASACVVDSQ